jgi:hypothetical protein
MMQSLDGDLTLIGQGSAEFPYAPADARSGVEREAASEQMSAHRSHQVVAKGSMDLAVSAFVKYVLACGEVLERLPPRIGQLSDAERDSVACPQLCRRR